MPDRLINLLLLKLKIVAIVFIVALIGLVSVSFTTTQRLADDIWKQLGVTKVEGTSNIKESFLSGYLYYYSARNAKNIAAGDRAAVAKDLMIYAKQYLSSEGFKKEYAKIRKDATPMPSQFKVRDKEEIRKEKIAEAEKIIRESEETVKKNPQMKDIMKIGLDYQKKNLADYKDPNSKLIQQYWQNDKDRYDSDVRYYNESMKRWEKDYPENFSVILKQRLQTYLDLAATVDFNAELKQVGKKKKFVNPVYEGKADNWKQIYRAGKDVYEVTKVFAQQWLSELK
jgi:hypothetical protein